MFVIIGELSFLRDFFCFFIVKVVELFDFLDFVCIFLKFVINS